MSVQAVFFDFGGTLFSYLGAQDRSFLALMLEGLARLRVDGDAGAAARAFRQASAEAFERAGLSAHLDAWTSSEEARTCKPHSGIYHYALAKAGQIAPERCVFVGDSPEQDIAGALRLGMHTILISDNGVERPASGAGRVTEPHHRIKDLRDIPELLRRLS